MTIDSSKGFWDIVSPGHSGKSKTPNMLHALSASSYAVKSVCVVHFCVCMCVAVVEIEITCTILGHFTSLCFDLIPSSIWDLIFCSLFHPPLSPSTTHIIVTSLELKLSCPTPALMDRTQPTSCMMKLGHRPVCVFSHFQLHWTVHLRVRFQVPETHQRVYNQARSICKWF